MLYQHSDCSGQTGIICKELAIYLQTSKYFLSEIYVPYLDDLGIELYRK